jgi:predicted AlkP superfamily phosphohydrolase/phosphomutase
MRFLRMFTNSLLAGGLSAAYLTVLLLQLNPHVPLLSATTWWWFATLGITYGLHLAIAFYLLIVAREVFSMDPMSPGWASVRVLAWLSATGAAVAATLMWLNVNGLHAVLGEIARRRMMAGALATSAAAIILLAIAVVHYSYGRRGSRVGGTLFVMAALGSVILPFAARGAAVPRPAARQWGAAQSAESETEPTPRVVMLLLDGASLEYIRTKSAEGRLPNFSKLLESGASMYLATIRPTQPGPVWAAAATGMYPAKNGVRSATEYLAQGDSRPVDLLPDHCFSHALVQLGVVRAEPNTSAAWQARPLWSILSNAGVSAGIVRWPLTYPAQPMNGFVLSESFHELLGSMAQFDEGAAYPATVLADVRVSFSDESGAELVPPDPREAPEVSAARRDRLYTRAMHDLRSRWNPQVVALRLQALDTAGHRYYEDGQPSAFGDGPEPDRRIRAQQLERAYADVDREVGAALNALAPGDLLLVISGFGMQRLHPAKELLARALGDPATRGTHERAPDGFLAAYGTAVQPGRMTRGSIVDVTPTVLYFLGLPIGRDMDGFARTDLFTTGFTAERPIAFIASHNRE